MKWLGVSRLTFCVYPALCSILLFAVVMFIKVDVSSKVRVITRMRPDHQGLNDLKTRSILQGLLPRLQLQRLELHDPSQHNVIMALVELEKREREKERTQSTQSVSVSSETKLTEDKHDHSKLASRLSLFHAKATTDSYEPTRVPFPSELHSKHNSGHDSTTVLDTVESATSGLDTSERDPIVRYSQNPDIDERGKWQTQQIDKYCRKYSEDHLTHTLPPSATVHRHNLYRHLIFDDTRLSLFCFIPKVGCTNMRRLLLVLQGLLPVQTIHWKRVPETEYLSPGMQKASFLSRVLSDRQRLYKIKNYWKFMMVRNPLERLVSAYRNKLSKPLNISLRLRDSFEMLKLSILLKYRPQVLGVWFQTSMLSHVSASRSHDSSNRSHDKNFNQSHDHIKQSHDSTNWSHDKSNQPHDLTSHSHDRIKRSHDRSLTVDFESYLRWIIDTPNHELNEHFAPMIELAQPCRIRYQFYGNFKMFSSDVYRIMNKLNVPREYFHDRPYHVNGTKTHALLHTFYSQVHSHVKRKLYVDFYQELDLYYSLYPEERYSHVDLLGTYTSDKFS